MRILRFEVEGFRSLRNIDWRPGKLNVVIGPNGSGKSNLLRILELLSVAARGGLGNYVIHEGGVEPLVWDGKADHIRVRCKLSPAEGGLDPDRDSLTYDLSLGRLGVSSAYRIDSEILGNYRESPMAEALLGARQYPFKLLERDPRNAVVFDIQQRQLWANQGSVPDEETLLSLCAGPFTANAIIFIHQQHIARWKIYQSFLTDRDAPIRAPAVARHESSLDPDGQNLISVLHTLYSTDREFKDEVNTAMRTAFSDDFDEIVFPPAADQRIQLRLRWRSLRREQSAADLSDGTLRFLFLMAALANPSPPPLIAIDEPETGLHPSMLPIVAEYARDAAQRTQVILTTHSPELLDAFGNDPPTTTVAEWKDGQTMLRVLAGDSLDYWLKKYTLGELYRSKELESMS
jgi:predicted ATPase